MTKFSNYIEVLPWRGSYSLFNKLNGMLVLLDKSDVYLDSDRSFYYCGKMEKDFISLEENMFFAPDSFVQSKIRNECKPKEKYDDIELTISLTEQCNCNCGYCYQCDWDKNSQIQENAYFSWIVDYFKNILVRSPSDAHFQVKFFGGEPLLKEKLILQFKDAFEKAIIDSHQRVHIRYLIDTNCTLLSREFMLNFDELSVSTTLTLREDHNALRSNSFDKTMGNIMRVSDLFRRDSYQLNIGYNMHHGNVAEFDEFLNMIRATGLRCKIYVTNIVNKGRGQFTNKLPDEVFQKIYYDNILPKLLVGGYAMSVLPPSGFERKCPGVNKFSRKFFSNGTQELCSFFPKPNVRRPSDFPLPITPACLIGDLPEMCIKCYDYPYCGGARPCIQCDGHFKGKEEMQRMILCYLDYMKGSLCGDI